MKTLLFVLAFVAGLFTLLATSPGQASSPAPKAAAAEEKQQPQDQPSIRLVVRPADPADAEKQPSARLVVRPAEEKADEINGLKEDLKACRDENEKLDDLIVLLRATQTIRDAFPPEEVVTCQTIEQTMRESPLFRWTFQARAITPHNARNMWRLATAWRDLEGMVARLPTPTPELRQQIVSIVAPQLWELGLTEEMANSIRYKLGYVIPLPTEKPAMEEAKK